VLAMQSRGTEGELPSGGDAAASPDWPSSWLGLERGHLERACDELGVSRVHARTLLGNTHRLRLARPWEDRSLPAALVAALASRFPLAIPEIRDERRSTEDGAIKLLLEPEGGAPPGDAIESVLIPEAARLTLCVSSQIGCGRRCVFCHTGRMGLIRDLTSAEIVAQAYAVNRWLDAHPEWLAARGFRADRRVTNVVFMGMGEPLDNVPAVSSAVAILSDRSATAIPLRRITVSTAGNLDGLEQLVAVWPAVRVALSLHAVDDRTRSGLMPINERWPLPEVTERLRRLSEAQGQPIFVQYTLLAGVNDSAGHAAQLAEWTRQIPRVKVNLIPFNPFPGSRLAPPDDETVAQFRAVLHRAGLRVMLRHSKGRDIAAACGQLAFATGAAAARA